MIKNIPRGLSRDQYLLLCDVVKNRCPELYQYLEKNGPLSNKERLDIQDCIGDELIANGFNENDEPNKRGIALEDLIDWLGRLKI